MEGDLVPLQFDVENDSYGTFINNLSEQLGNHPDHLSNIEEYGPLISFHPLLPKQNHGQPERWMGITLLAYDSKNNETKNTTIAVRADNVYLLGFKNQQDKWYEFGRETAPNKNSKLNVTHFLTGSTFLGFSFHYHELIGPSGWSDKKLGMISAREAVFELSKYNGRVRRKNCIKLYLAKLIVMICESARMFSYRRTVGSGWSWKTEIVLTDPKQIKYLNNWENISQAMMGWAEYTLGLKLIGIEGEKHACQVVHLILNSPTGRTVRAKGNKSAGGDDPGNGHPGDGNNHASQHGNGDGNNHASQHGNGDGNSDSPPAGGSDGQLSNRGHGDGQSLQPKDCNENCELQQHVDHGQSLVEVFTLGKYADINFLGSIIVFDGRHGQIIFWDEEGGAHREGNSVLTGPYRGISADGRVALKIIPVSQEATDDVSIWDPYTEDEHQYDKILIRNIPGGLKFEYAVLSSAVEASVQVHVFLFETVAVYGQITVQSRLANGEEATVVLLSSGVEEKVELHESSDGSRIQLTRSVVAWPVCSSIDVNVDCCFQPVITPTDEGTSSFASVTTPLTFTFDHQTAKVRFSTLEGIGYVRVSVDDTCEYRDEPNNSLPRSLTNQENMEMFVENGLLVVHPSQLTFTISPKKIMSCLIHLSNKSYDDYIGFRCRPGHRTVKLSGILPPNSTSTYLVRLESTVPPNKYSFSFILESCVVLDEEEEEEDEKDVETIFDMQTNQGIAELSLTATVCCPAEDIATTSEVETVEQAPDEGQDWLAAFGSGDGGSGTAGGVGPPSRDWIAAYRARAAPARAGLRRNSADYSKVETAAFLRHCGLCRRLLGPGGDTVGDTFMYKGEVAFCSLECRQQHITHEACKEKCTARSPGTPPSGSARTYKTDTGDTVYYSYGSNIVGEETTLLVNPSKKEELEAN